MTSPQNRSISSSAPDLSETPAAPSNPSHGPIETVQIDDDGFPIQSPGAFLPPYDSTQSHALPNPATLTQPTLLESPPLGLIIVVALIVMIVGLSLGSIWLGVAGAIVALVISLRVIWADLQSVIQELIAPRQRTLIISLLGLVVSGFGLLQISGVWQRFGRWYGQLNWDALGATGEVIGAVGQILIAILAVYVAWRQYVISKDLTIQQNIITQQQTIDSFFQGISELVLDEEGLLEDLPLERAIAEGRTAAILSSIDAQGKAKVLRFLSQSRLLTPLKRDGRLGRAILDGGGGYAEDRDYGTKVIDLGVMLAGANLVQTDLRWVDLSDINLIRANLSGCELVKVNFSRTILYSATLCGSDLMGCRLFYGPAETASPRTRTDLPNYKTGEFTGAVVENANFTGVQRLSEEQRYYCCAWGGAATRATIPGGCEGIPDRLQR
jgi:uncharacterized protein YjbI with pentapeptide repeats